MHHQRALMLMTGLALVTSLLLGGAAVASLLAQPGVRWPSAAANSVVPTMRDLASPVATSTPGPPACAIDPIQRGSVGPPIVRWHFQTEGAIFSAPARLNHMLFVGSWDTHLYAVNSQTGAERWRYATGQRVDHAPVVGDGLVFVGSPDGAIHAVDVATGRVRWRADVTAYPAASPVVAGNALLVVNGLYGVAPTVAGHTAYVGGGYDGLFVQALDAATGEERWRFPLARNGLYALDAATGAERWFLGTRLRLTAAPVVDGKWAYAVDEALHKIDAANGGERWQVPLERSAYARAIAVGGMIYLATDDSARPIDGMGSAEGWLIAYDDVSGAEQWRFPTGGLAWSIPVVAGDAVFIGGYDGNLYALDAATGKQRWRFEVGGHLAPPMLDCGTLYVGNYDGSLVAIANA